MSEQKLTDQQIHAALDRAFAHVRKQTTGETMAEALVWLSGWTLGFAQRMSPGYELPELCTVKEHDALSGSFLQGRNG